MLHGEQILARRVQRRGDAAHDIVDLAELHQGFWGTKPARTLLLTGLLRRGCGRSAANRLDNLRRQPEPHVFRHHFHFPETGETLPAQELNHFFHQALRRRAPAVKATLRTACSHSGRMAR